MIKTDGKPTIAWFDPKEKLDGRVARYKISRPPASELKKLSTDRDLAQSC